MRFHPFLRGTLPLLAAAVLGACNDEPDLGFDDWTAVEDTVTLYSVAFPEYQGLPSAYDIRDTRTIRVEDPSSSGQWEFALTGGGDAPLTLTPLGAFFDLDNNAGLATLEDELFEELDEAPTANSAYVTDEPIAIEEGVVYVVRSRTAGSCIQFAKIEPLVVDQEAGTLEFRVTANPLCNDTALIPPED